MGFGLSFRLRSSGLAGPFFWLSWPVWPLLRDPSDPSPDPQVQALAFPLWDFSCWAGPSASPGLSVLAWAPASILARVIRLLSFCSCRFSSSSFELMSWRRRLVSWNVDVATTRTLNWSSLPHVHRAQPGHHPVRPPKIPWQTRFLPCLLKLFACVAIFEGAQDVVFPQDVRYSIDHILLRIMEPKTRFRAARHQSSKLEAPDLMQVAWI